ncbi:hypothetical protein [Halocalculus aciditolerans]|uniref:CHAT domain-containing protein n=1 Tax=Halocalculus aciditolerans TaxID=1383812 RepID=A0A830FIN5_9EURY|nr:hypothetical protein [Halocalculus aciditolerans]GGL59746.1 hypothetical protein GCM10009039_17470 [Halocalculus aciditolerans]
MRPEFTSPESGYGVRIEDPIENAQAELYTPAPVAVDAVGDDEFYFPIDAAVRFTTESIVYPHRHRVYVRRRDGDLVGEFVPGEDPLELPDGRYNVELSSAPVKTYLLVDGRLDVTESEHAIEFDFDADTTVRVGARSFHESPAGTITVTDDVEDVMRAVSLFGSSLKTLSPERSFPTLRGHPPLVERGDEFRAPAGIEPPDSAVEIAVPADYRYVYPAVPLAFYLGATLTPSDAPELRLPERTYDLTADGTYEATVNRLLRQFVLFDCVVRTEGYYPVDLAERDAFDAATDLDPAALYDLDLTARLDRYLDVSRDAVADILPEWHLTTDIAPSPEQVELLPFLANDLSLVRTTGTAATGDAPEPADTQFRTPSGELLVDPDPVDTPEHVWAAPGYPLGANKASVAACRRRLDRTPPEKSFIEIHIVCNDEQMTAESAVDELYGLREMIQFDVNVHYELSQTELADLLERDFDFLHYIGHVNEDGLQCADGFLDAHTLDDVRVKSFLLNACHSYDQGQALIENGSYAGVVTLDDVADSMATRVGKSLARLLNAGFTIRSSLGIVQNEMFTGDQYIVLGDGGTTIVQSQTGMPASVDVAKTSSSEVIAEFTPHPSPEVSVGGILSIIDVTDLNYLSLGTIGPMNLQRDELAAVFREALYPIHLGGQLVWSDEVDAKNLP